MPKCKNDPNKSYEGNEPSPKGLGICAHAEKLNSKKKGKDGNMWIVTETKNGVKRWVKYDTSKQKKSDGLTTNMFFGVPDIPLKDISKHMNKDGTLKIIYDDIMPEIKKNGIRFFVVLLPRSKHNGIYWTDYAGSYLTQKYGENVFNEKSYVILTVYLHENLSINFNKNPVMDYNLEKPQQQKVADIFVKKLPYNYDWDGNDLKMMKISYEKNKNKIQKITLDDSPNYPRLWVHVDLKIKSVGLFELGGFQDAKELKKMDSILEKAKSTDYGYGDSDFEITFNGIKNNEKAIRNYFDKLKKIGTLTFDKTVLKITKIRIEVYDN